MIKKILKNDFNKNVLTLLTGTTVAQAIPIAISPILTRLYSPSDFGVLALFVAITSIFGSIANARYELAIVLPEKEEDSINLAALSILIALIMSLCLLVFIVYLHTSILKWLNNEAIGIWLYFIPLVVLLIGIFNALNFLNTRMKTFGNIAKVTIHKSLVLSTVQLLFGFLKLGVSGLVLGQIFSHLAANGKLGTNVLKNKELIAKISFNRMRKVAKRYIDFPKYSMWAILANSLSQNLTNIFISTIYSVATLGHYSLVQRILGMPTSIIGNSIGQVFFQKASEERNKKGHAISTFNSTIKKLLVIALPSFLILFFIIKDIVIIVFGIEWEIAGEYAQVILPLIACRFIISPLSIIANIFEKHKILLVWQIVLLLLSLLVFGYAQLFKLPFLSLLVLLTITLCIHYLLLFVIIFKLSKGTVNNKSRGFLN